MSNKNRVFNGTDEQMVRECGEPNLEYPGSGSYQGPVDNSASVESPEVMGGSSDEDYGL